MIKLELWTDTRMLVPAPVEAGLDESEIFVNGSMWRDGDRVVLFRKDVDDDTDQIEAWIFRVNKNAKVEDMLSCNIAYMNMKTMYKLGFDDFDIVRLVDITEYALC